METFLDVVGGTALVFLALVGLVAGLVAGAISGGNKLAYAAAGVVGAVLLPFVLAALGATFVVGAGLILILVVGAIGAILLLAIVRAIFGSGDKRDV